MTTRAEQLQRDRVFWSAAGKFIQQRVHSTPSSQPITDADLEAAWEDFQAQYPSLFTPVEHVPNTCASCYGYGLWDDDSGQPMGPLDGVDGMPTKACPECGENPTPRQGAA